MAESIQPARGVLWEKGGKVQIGNEPGKGSMVYLEVFAFDKEEKKCGPVRGLLTSTMQDCPVPIVTYSMSPQLTGSACMRYANVILDFSQLSEPREIQRIANQIATDGTKCCSVRLLPGKFKELFISPEYVVFPDQVRKVAKDGPFVKVRFDFGPERKDGEPADDALLVVARNGKEIARAKVTETHKHVLQIRGVKTAGDVVEWRVEGAGGEITHQGMFGFPMSGAVPGLVEYVVSVPQGEQKKVDKTEPVP